MSIVRAGAVVAEPIGDGRAGGEQDPHDLGVGLGRDLVDRSHRRAALGIVTVARAVKRGSDRAAAVAEGERRAALDELARHLHAAAPARVAERDLLAVRVAVDPRARVEQPAHRLEVSALDRQHHHLVER